MNWLEKVTRPEILTLTPYSSARNEYTGKSLIQLDANESPYRTFGCDEELFNRYPEPQPQELCAKLAEMYGVQPQQILVTRGVDECIDLLISAFCIAYKDAIVVTPPTYGCYSVFGKIRGVEILEVPLKNSFEQNVEALKEASKNQQANIKLIFLCSPNNPTGNLVSLSDVQDVCSAYAEKALVVVDEAYIEFSDTTSATTLLDKNSNLVVVRTLSKAFAMAGVRVGSLMACKEIINILRKVIHPYPLPRPCIKIALECLSKEGLALSAKRISEIKGQRDYLMDELSKLPNIEKIYDSSANFILIIANDAKNLYEKLKAKGIIIRSRANDIPNGLRITVGSPQENQMLLQAMKECL